MVTTLPKVATRKVPNGGWLNTCTCRWESWHERRPAADRAANEHRANHVKAGAR